MRTENSVDGNRSPGSVIRKPVLPSTCRAGRPNRRPLGLIGLLAGVVVWAGCLATPALATDGPIFLFGGKDLGEFLGCLNCYRSEAFSVWNESGEFGAPTSPNSIWNRSGEYGSLTSDTSPWNPRATAPPVAVDRVGNLYGYFTRNPVHPRRVRRNETHAYRDDFDLLAWLLENYDWVVTHLDEMREQY
jgi:hypothetical protein